MARVGAGIVAIAAVITMATAFVSPGGVRLSTNSVPHAGGRRSRPGSRRSSTSSRSRPAVATTSMMAIRAVENFNSAFTLDDKTASTLDAYLRHKDMIAEVCKQFDCTEAEYTGELFQPVPYSAATPRGMPADIEGKYYLNEEYGIANIPPVVMFNAKIFKPSRLCAVFKVGGLSEAAKEAHREKVQRARENEKRKKEEELLENEWDDLGSAITEVFNMPVGQDDDDVDLDSMVV